MRTPHLLLPAVMGCSLVVAVLVSLQISITAAHSAPSYLDRPGAQSDPAIAQLEDFLYASVFRPVLDEATAKLELGGQIAGKVTDANTGLPLDYVVVSVYTSTSNLNSVVAWTFTGASGVYTLTGLAAGTYYVGFVNWPYITEYFNGKPTLATADLVSVTLGGVTGNIDAALSSPGQITGQVTDVNTGLPLEWVYVHAYPLPPYGRTAEAFTDASGVYTLTGLEAKTYYVNFEKADYLTEYYDDKPTLATADPVSVTLGNVTGNIDAALLPPGEITGQVTDAGTGLPLKDVAVKVYSSPDSYSFAWTFTDSSGVYTLTGLATGTYYVSFEQEDYLTAYYDDKPTLATANPVSVTLGNVTGNVDAALLRGGKITGRVTSAGNDQSLQGVSVNVYTSTIALIGNTVTTAWTNSSGVYTLTPLLSGTYYVKFEQSPFLPEYYDDQSSLSTANPVSVALGTTTSGIDAVLPISTVYLPIVFHEYHPTVVEISTSSGLPNVIVLNLKNDQGWMHPRYSLDGGITWQAVATVPWNDQPVADVRLVIAPRTDHSVRILAATDSGLYRTGDFGQSWAFVGRWNQGDFTSDVLVASPADPFRVYRTLHYEVWNISPPFPPEFFSYGFVSVSNDAGVSWTNMAGGQDWQFDAIVPSPTIADLVYTHYSHWDNFNFTSGWLPSVNLNSSYFVIDSQDPARLYTIGERSSDSGATWVPWANSPCAITQLLPHPTKSRILFARCDQGLFRSNNAGDQWVQLSTTPGDLLAPDYGNPGRLIWAQPNGVWVSCDDGNHWVAIGLGCLSSNQ